MYEMRRPGIWSRLACEMSCLILSYQVITHFDKHILLMHALAHLEELL